MTNLYPLVGIKLRLNEFEMPVIDVSVRYQANVHAGLTCQYTQFDYLVSSESCSFPSLKFPYLNTREKIKLIRAVTDSQQQNNRSGTQSTTNNILNLKIIGHFRVPKSFTFKTRLSAKLLLWK